MCFREAFSFEPTYQLFQGAIFRRLCFAHFSALRVINIENNAIEIERTDVFSAALCLFFRTTMNILLYKRKMT